MGPRNGKHKVGYVAPDRRVHPVVEREPEPQPRQMKIMRAAIKAMRLFRHDFEEHGCTKGCKGCSSILRKVKHQSHSDACRTHMETVLAATTSG
eukprot:7503633-Heterocapsa_arctica.AAC.1